MIESMADRGEQLGGDRGALLRFDENPPPREEDHRDERNYGQHDHFVPIVTPTSEVSSSTQGTLMINDELLEQDGVSQEAGSSAHSYETDPCDTKTASSGLDRQEDDASSYRKSCKRKQSFHSEAFERTRFKDIIGHGAVKLRIEEMLLPMALPMSVADSVLTGIRALPASILLYGPPGCGKTQLARSIAGEARAAFYSIAPSDVLSKFVGESEAAVRGIFRKAMEHAAQLESKCAVVFFDEIDALGQSRSGRGSENSGESEGCSRRILAELLLEMNRIADRSTTDSNDKSSDVDDHESDDEEESAQASVVGTPSARVLVVAATNRAEDCDPALLRRFGTRIFVGPPSKRDREKMLKRHLSGINHNLTPSDIDVLAESTNNWSGSDIQSVSREAAMAPVRECIRSAVLRRKRAARLEQQGDPQETNPDLEARQAMIDGVQNLRPVSFDDFARAVDLFLGLHENGGHCPSYEVHYDSSSDEEDAVE